MIILHVIADLTTGGAEMMLKRLAEAHRSNPEFEHHVVSLHSIGRVGPELEQLGVPLHALGLRRVTHIPGTLWRLAVLLRKLRPAVVHAWMYHANIFAGLAGLLCGRPPLIWGIRASTLDETMGVARATLILRRHSALASRLLPDVIAYVAQSARLAHEELGYDRRKGLVIPNGYPPPRVGKREARRSTSEIVVGSIGRFNAAKAPKTFVEAAAHVVERRPDARFVMVGRDLSDANAELMSWIGELGLERHIRLWGERKDVDACLAAMDIFCLHSATEAFPNVVAEAMNAGLSCVATDVGDTALLLGDAGILVPPRDPKALADALLAMMSASPEERMRFGERGRRRISECYSLESVVKRYEALYRATAKGLPVPSEATEVERSCAA